jgi:hypothetical protein
MHVEGVMLFLIFHLQRALEGVSVETFITLWPIHMFRFMITFASCFIVRKAHMWGTFLKMWIIFHRSFISSFRGFTLNSME